MLLCCVWGLCTDGVAVMTGTLCCWDCARLMCRPVLVLFVTCLPGSGPALLPRTSDSFSSTADWTPASGSSCSAFTAVVVNWSLALLSPGITVSAASLVRALPGLLGRISEVFVVGLLTLAAVVVAVVTGALTSCVLCLSVKSMHVHRPLFNGSVVSTFTTLNLVLKSWGPTTTGWLLLDSSPEHSMELNTATAPLTVLSR